MKNWYIAALIIFCWTTSAKSQLSFTNSNNRLVNPDFHSGVALGVSDINGDRLDDIIRLADGMELYVEYQVPGPEKFISRYYGSLGNSSQWAQVIGDINNDGFNDVLTGNSGSRVRYARSQGNGFGFDIELISGTNLFCQGMNMADINHDGHLDLFICNDVEENWIFGNDGNGNLVPANDWIDMSTVPPSDNSGNYASIWTDFDNDGDLDLYISKCRQGVTDPTDPRRINQLFVNDGTGNYTEQADSFGLASGDQSWATDFGDIDNDGDLDAVIINHDAPTQLLENDGNGHFTDITDGSNIWVNGQPLQICFRDFDNNGYLDIVVAGSVHKLFLNNGDKTFTNVTSELFDENQIESFALGDLNSDGFLDIYAGYARIFTQPSNIDDVIWLNDGNDNHWLEFSLEAATGQVNAVGARLELYGPWGVQLREVRSGEGYGIHNSFTKHFGIGSEGMADSLVIRWPSGTVDVHRNIAADQFLVAYEGGCLSGLQDPALSGPTTFCTGETLEIEAPAGYSYLWPTGDTTQTLIVDSTGLYHARLVSPDTGCVAYTRSIHAIVDPDETPIIEVDGEPTFCEGGSVILRSNEPEQITWSNGDTLQEIEVSQSGNFFVTFDGLCRSFNSDTVLVESIVSNPPTLIGDTLTEPGQAVLEGIGDSIFWYDTPIGGIPLDTGRFYQTPVLDETTTFFADNNVFVPGEVAFGGKEDFTGGGGLNSANLTGGLRFDVYEEFNLVSVLVLAYDDELRTFQLKDENDSLLQETTVFVEDSVQRVTLNWLIEPGDGYVITMEGNPKMFRNNMNVQFPYPLGEWGEIRESVFGPFFYYFFYDWEMKKEDLRCSSNRVSVVVLYDETIGTFDPNQEWALSLFPNPAGESLFIERSSTLNQSDDYKWQIFNIEGRQLEKGVIQLLPGSTSEIDVSRLSEGMYILEMNSQGRTFSRRFAIFRH